MNRDDNAHNRRHPRVRLEIKVAFETETNFYWRHTENLSEAGLFVATHQSIPVGTAIDLVMMVPDGVEPILVAGTVCWLRFDKDDSTGRSSGMGIKFGPLTSRDADRIRAFIVQRQPLKIDTA